MAAYQFLCDQFGFPTLPNAWQVTGAHIPWWGWILIGQLLFQIALVNYIRRLTGDLPALPEPTVSSDEADLPYPDMKFDEVVGRVAGQLKAQQPDAKITMQDVALEILDKVKLRELQVWGRSGNTPLNEVSGYEWESATIKFSESGIAIPGAMSSYVISDLHFWSAEIDKVWPPIV